MPMQSALRMKRILFLGPKILAAAALAAGCGQSDTDETSSPLTPRCEQPIETGPCRAAIPRWAFNPETAACEPFVYGGCQGNLNNFKSEAACLLACAEPTPKVCGGLRGATCEADEFCDFPNDRCGAADVTGVCRPRPDVCTEEYDPACGCDDQRYSNVCMAHRAGVDVSPGPCDGSG